PMRCGRRWPEWWRRSVRNAEGTERGPAVGALWHARPLERAIGSLETGRHPDYWHFLTETDAVRQTVARVVAQIREERGGH
ncbi:hypothetical protein ACWDZ8_05010, partial [Streptomyces sp. NPDC003233]